MGGIKVDLEFNEHQHHTTYEDLVFLCKKYIDKK